MSILDTIRNSALARRLGQEKDAIQQGHIGLGPDPNGPGITVPGGRFSAQITAPVHALGLIGEGSEGVAQAVMGTLGGLIVGSQQAGYYALHPNEQPSETDQHYINAFNLIKAGHPIAANEEMGRANKVANALGTFAVNPMNLVGAGDALAPRVAEASPRLAQALQGLSTAGRLVNDAPLLPARAAIAAVRAPAGERGAAALGPLVQAVSGEVAARVPQAAVPAAAKPSKWTPEQLAIINADPEVQRLQEMIGIVKGSRSTSLDNGMIGVPSDRSKQLRGLGMQLSQAQKKALARAPQVDPATDVSGITPGLAYDRLTTKQQKAAATNRMAVGTAAGETLDDYLQPQQAQEVRQLFPNLTEDRLVATLIQGKENQPAFDFANLISKNWDRARAGQLTAHDVINSYVPAVLSQRRGAMTAEGILASKRTGGFMDNPDIMRAVNEGVTLGDGGDAGKYRPEDLAAIMLHYTPEGRDLGSALRYGDPQAIQTAIDNFNTKWPHAGFMPGEGGDITGGERGALVQAGHDDVFSSVAEMINRMATSGMSGDEVAQVMRDWTAGAQTGRITPALRRKIESLGGNDSRLPQTKNWGAIIDRVANGKSGFLTTNMGGPSATFDVRVQDAMKKGATIEDYQRGLDLLFPHASGDPGLQHHLFWDAQDFSQTPHSGIAESVKLIAQGKVPGATTGPFDSPFNISPGLAQDLQGQTSRVDPSGLPLTPPLGEAEAARSRYQQQYLNDPQRVATDVAANKELARKAYQFRTGTTAGFDALWQRVNDWVESTKTISMGVGDADSVKRIIEGTKDRKGNVIRPPGPLTNGMNLHGVTPEGGDFPLSLIDSKAKALGLDKGERKNEAVAYGVALGVNDPKEAIRAYAKHFLRIEAGSFGRIGLGNPTIDQNVIHGMYASVHEGLPGLQQMGGGVHLLIDPHTTEYTTAVHHPFSFESPAVLPMHEGTSAALKDTWTPTRQAELAQAAGRPPMEQFGPEGEYQISGSPMLVGPQGTTAARAAALFMTDGGPNLKIAAEGDVERAAALMARGGPGQGRGFSIEAAAREAAKGKDASPSLMYNTAQSSSFKRTEAMIHTLTPDNVTGVVVRGTNEKTVTQNAQAARDLMAHFGIDAPIYVAWGAEGETPGVYKLTDQGPVLTSLNEGRQKLTQTIRDLGETDYGLTPGAAPPLAIQRQGQTPGQWLNTPVVSGIPGGNRLAMMGSGGLVGAAVGGTQGDTPEERAQNAAVGAAVGAGAGGALVSARGYNLLRNLPTLGEFGKALLGDAVTAQKAAMSRKNRGIASLSTLTSVWKVQATSTLRNLLQDESTARLWLADAGVRRQLMNDNWASMIQLYNAGVRDPYDALPTMTTQMLDALGKNGYVPKVGASFADVNQGIVKTLSAADTAKAEAGLSLLNPLQGGIPVAGVALAGVKGYTRAFQQSLFGQLNEFTRVASRHAAWQDTMERELPTLADKFIAGARRGGVDLSALQPRSGLFSAADVDAIQPGLGRAWDAQVNGLIARGEARAQDILGNYSKKLPGEQAISSVIPFASFALRSYPRTAKMMLNHPGTSLMIMLLMARGAEQAKEQGLPGYLAGGVEIPDNTPVVGGVARALNGGQPGTSYAQPLQLLSPVGGQALSPDDLPPDATAYQKAKSMVGRVGFGFTPLIQALAVATNNDYQMPGALSRTAPIEQALPGPQVPSLTQGPINFARQQAGGTAITATTRDRLMAAEFFRRTGVPINDPRVQASPQLAGLLAQTLDPESEISQTVAHQEMQSSLARVGVGMTSPVSVSGQSDVQQVQSQAQQREQALPPAVADPAVIRQMENSPYLTERLQARRMLAQNAGTQGQPIPEAHITSGASGDARKKEVLRAWQTQNIGLLQIAPTLYHSLENQLKQQLGLP